MKQSQKIFKEWDKICKDRKEKCGGVIPVDHGGYLDTLESFQQKFLPDETSVKTWPSNMVYQEPVSTIKIEE